MLCATVSPRASSSCPLKTSEDLAAYKTFSDEYLGSLAPETFPERQYAQTVIDTQWRLNRVRALEDGMLALGHYGNEGPIEAGHPEIHAALTAAAVWRDHSQAFVNLTMHEQRLYRILKDASKPLEDMEAKRIAARQAALDMAREQHNLNKMLGVAGDPVTSGFVLTPEEIDGECRRHRRVLEAKIAHECHYDREKFR
jgi:hypothetical protein